jgi:uncharacterized membrane protein
MLISVRPAIAGLKGWTAMMFGYAHAGGGPSWEVATMWLGVIVAVVGLLIWSAYAVARTSSRRGGHGPVGGAADPGPILDERLARGEIDADEYTRLREMIGLHETPAEPVGS